MIAPASQQLAERFDIHNTVTLSMTISIFVLAYGVYLPFPTGSVIPCIRSAPIIAFGPLFLGPLSEVYGRSPIIQLSNLWYLSMRFTCLRMIANGTFLPSSLEHSMWLREQQE